MSRTTASIMRINQQLDKISGLDGIAADLIEHKEKEIEKMVKYILNEHPNANIFDYNGYKKNRK